MFCLLVIVRALHAPVFILLPRRRKRKRRKRRRRSVSRRLRGLLPPGGEHREAPHVPPEPGPADDGRYTTT